MGTNRSIRRRDEYRRAHCSRSGWRAMGGFRRRGTNRSWYSRCLLGVGRANRDEYWSDNIECESRRKPRQYDHRIPPGMTSGEINATNAETLQAQSDLTFAYDDAAGRALTESVADDLVGRTLQAEVYNSTGHWPPVGR